MPEESVAEFAEREGISTRRVRALIQQGRLPARQVGRQWLVDQASVRRPAPSRPLSERMQAGLLDALSGSFPPEAPAAVRLRLRRRIADLRASDDPAGILRGWVPQKVALKLVVASADLDDLAEDRRITRSGFSDPRAQIAAAGQLECHVAEADLDDLCREYLLRPSAQPNVLLHVAESRPASPVPLGLLLVDLAHHEGVREQSRVAVLLREEVVS